MKRLCLLVISALVAALVLVAGVAQAKGIPTKVVITGPGLVHPLVVTGAAAHPLGMFSLDDFNHPLAQVPTHLGPGYLLVRDDFDHLRYYPAARQHAGYIYYIGIVHNGWSAYDHHWYRAGAKGEHALQHILVSHGVVLPAAQP